MMAEKLVVYMANSMLQISDISSKLKAKSYKKKLKATTNCQILKIKTIIT